MNKCSLNELEKIASVLNLGGVIAMPTDTIYGLATNLDNYSKIINLKKRDNKPLAIMVSNKEELKSIINTSENMDLIIDRFLPGALTIIGETVDERFSINDGYNTTGVRIPNHPSVLKLLSITGPLVVSSANISGEVDNYLLEDVIDVFSESVDLYVENDQLPLRVASTVIDGVSLEIYRDGAIYDEITEFIANNLV